MSQAVDRSVSLLIGAAASAALSYFGLAAPEARRAGECEQLAAAMDSNRASLMEILKAEQLAGAACERTLYQCGRACAADDRLAFFDLWLDELELELGP